MGQLDRSPRKNWVEEQGGLPRYIERIAIHLVNDRGFTVCHAVATAVNASLTSCRTGDVKQWPGFQNINPGSRAEACAAAAEWEAKKAAARAKRG
jgi:hypothetical protein